MEASDRQAKQQERIDALSTPEPAPEADTLPPPEPAGYFLGMDVAEEGIVVTILVPWPNLTLSGVEPVEEADPAS